MTSRWALFLLALGLAGCGDVPPPPAQSAQPQRVISLDFCADQYLLKLVDRERILAVSPDATADFSYMREAAQGLPTVRPVAEDALTRKPDLIMRSYGGGPNAAAFFERAGIPVVHVGWATDIAGVRAVIETTASKLGVPDRGAAVIAEMDQRLAAITAHRTAPNGEISALYMTPAGVTTGPGSMVHEAMRAAGLQNFESQSGWRSLPLERLVAEQPDMMAAAFFDTKTNHMHAWSAMRHPVARATLKDRPTAHLKGAWTACGGWFIMDAVETLAQTGRTLEPVQDPSDEN